LHNGASKRFIDGDHPRVQPLKSLDIAPKPLAVAFIPSAVGTLDDYFENWFLTLDDPPEERSEGLESVANLGLAEDWLPPPNAPVPGLGEPVDA